MCRLLHPEGSSVYLTTPNSPNPLYKPHTLLNTLLNAWTGCSIQDELFASFQQLLDAADKSGNKYDRCASRVLRHCVELSNRELYCFNNKYDLLRCKRVP